MSVPTLTIGVEELVIGNGLRGASEMEPVESMDADDSGKLVFSAPVETGVETLAEGVMIPPFPVAEEVAVLACIVMIFTLPVDETSTSGVGARLGVLSVEFEDDGGMRPDAAVENVVPVDPAVEKMSIPDETVMIGGNADDESGGAMLEELSGGMIPDRPVDEVAAVDPAVEKISKPEDTVTLTSRLGEDDATTELWKSKPGRELTLEALDDGFDTALEGGMIPFVPVE